MPDKKDRDMWWAFLQGKPESDWTPVPRSKGKHKKYQHQASSRGGMRAWADEPPTHNETSQYNDEGEVEQVLRMDPADSLPSPAGTPVPLEYLEDMMQPSASGSGPSTDKEHRPREPTTTLLKLIDGVSLPCIFVFVLLKQFQENRSASTDVLYVLDSAIPQVSSSQ
jgi:hypothetical protein